MTINEIIADIRSQLDWRGPGGQPQGNIVIPRKDAEVLLEALARKDLARND